MLVRYFPVILLSLVLLFPSSTALILGIGYGAGIHGLAQRTASAFATGTPPMFLYTPTPDPYPGDAGVPIDFTIAVSDDDDDTLNVTWDWGDGHVDTNLTAPALFLQVVQQTHTYNPVSVFGEDTANYTLNISLDDGNGNIVWDLTTMVINRPLNSPPSIVGITFSPSGAKIRVNPNDEVTIVANASDPEGDPLTWTFQFFENGTQYDMIVDETVRTSPSTIVWSNVSCSFSAVGNYTVLLNLTDAPPPYDVWPHNVSDRVDVEVYENAAPQSGTVLSVEPSNPVVSSETGYEVVNFTIGVADADGDVLIATWDFDDGSPPVVQTSPGGTDRIYDFLVVRNYTDVGFFNVTVNVTDGIPGHELSLSAFVQVNSTNRPPTLALDYNISMGSYALVDEVINFTLVFTDPEWDPIQVIVDFGDNSSKLYFNLTDFVGNNVTLSLNHSYANVGDYVVKIWYTDNKTGLFNHVKLVNITLEIDAPVVIASNPWSWWDYTSLGLICMIPVLIVIRFVQNSRRRKAIEEQGMTYDEWRLRKSIDSEESSSRKEGGP